MINNNKLQIDDAKKFPYDFVPLENWLCLPEWCKGVSHDVPFSDGLSGKIYFNLHNMTPICVGDTKGSDDNLKMAQQSGKYIIPGSSIKGMIRSVLEAATFGKFDNYDDRILSHRIDFKKISKSDPIFIRFHKTEDGNYRWEYKNCKKVFALNDISILDITGFNGNDDAIKKYKKAGCEDKLIPFYANITNDRILKITKKESSSSIKGYLSFVNKPVNKNKPYYGYFFVDNSKDSYTPCDKAMIAKIQDFQQSQNSDQVKQLLKYTTSTTDCECVGMPVWKDYYGANEYAIGTCKISRVRYKNSFSAMADHINEYLNNDNAFDFAECMFGTIRKDKELIKYNLKGRVNFSDLIGPNATDQSIISKKYVLAEPKPSFYPLYVANSDTYDQPFAILAGRKRYKIVSKLFEPTLSNGNENILTKVDFLPKDNKFEGFLTFNNLRPIELGALLWCMTFGDNSECYHIIGHAKSYGAGVNKLEITDIEFNDFTKKLLSHLIKTKKEYLDCFSNYMDSRMEDLSGKPGKWVDTESIKKLLALAQIDELRNKCESAYVDFNEHLNIKNRISGNSQRKTKAKEPLNLIHIDCDVQDENSYNNMTLNESKYQKLINKLQENFYSVITNKVLNNSDWGKIKNLREDFEKIYQDLFSEKDPLNFNEEANMLYNLAPELTIEKTNKKKKKYANLFMVLYDNPLNFKKEDLPLADFKIKFNIK